MTRFPAILVVALLMTTVSVTRTAAQVPPLDRLAFMAGCWAGDGLEEHYSRPTTNLILGISRFVRDEVTREYEFSRIERSDSAVVLTPFPNGVSTVSFRLAALETTSVTFENPAHDFPQRIRYTRAGDTLVARIESMAGQGREWRMQSRPCDAR